MELKETVATRARLGVQAFADALLIIPKSLAQNSGYDRQEVTVKLQAEYSKSKVGVGIDLNTGDPMNPATAGMCVEWVTKFSIRSFDSLKNY